MQIINKGTQDLRNRASFLVMRDQLKKKGVDVRASLDDGDGAAAAAKGMEMGAMGGMGAWCLVLCKWRAFGWAVRVWRGGCLLVEGNELCERG